MRINRFEMHLYAVPLRRPLRTARGYVARREGLLLRLTDTDDVVGFGEAAPLPGWSPESLLMAQRGLAIAAARIEGADAPEIPEHIAAFIAALDLPPSAAHALDQALLDLAARRAGLTVARLLNPAAREVVAVGRLVHDARDAAEAARAGAGALKLKLGAESLEADLRRILTVRSLIDDGVSLRLDANGAWTEAEAGWMLERLGALSIECVEDPVSDLDAMARLRRFGVPLAADAPVRSPRDVADIIARGAADVIVVKPTFVGGLSAALGLLRQADDAGLRGIVTTVLGAAVERYGALQVSAAAPAGLLPCGLDTGGLLARDIAEGPEAAAGVMRADSPLTVTFGGSRLTARAPA